MISIKIDTKNADPSAKKAKKRLFELSTHPSAENEKNTFFFENFVIFGKFMKKVDS